MTDGVARTVEVALASYTTPAGASNYGLMGWTVQVHPDDVERFDRLNVAPTFASLDEGPNMVDVRREPTAVERRVAQGFGNDPITAEAQNIVLAAAERAARPVRKQPR